MNNSYLVDKLREIEPSTNGAVKYYPCRVKLKNGEHLDRVILVEEKSYLALWGKYPKDKESYTKYFIPFDSVKDLEESPYRLPPHLATKMYDAGESGMGYCVFTLVMKNEDKLPFVTGNIVDFPFLSPNYNYSDIVDIIPHAGRESLQDKQHHWLNKPNTNSTEFKRCIYKVHL